jgi:hypothetical protein
VTISKTSALAFSLASCFFLLDFFFLAASRQTGFPKLPPAAA